MGFRDFVNNFKSDQKIVAALVATQNGVDPKGISKISEIGEWAADLKEDDPRHKRIPEQMLEADYFLFSGDREFGSIVRVGKEELEVRLPYEMVLQTGLKVPYSHLFRKLPVRALAALEGQRAQKVIKNIVKDAKKCFQRHTKLCSSCFSPVIPTRYPGNPEVGVLGPPADKFTVCGTCLKKVKNQEEAAAEEVRKKALEAQEELRKRNMRR